MRKELIKNNLGFIPPNDWRIEKIGDFAEIKVGRDLKEDRFNESKTNDYKYPVYSNTVENMGLYGFYKKPEYSEKCVTVVGRGAGVGTAFKRDEPFGAIGRLLVLIPNGKVNSNYLKLFINDRVRFYNESTGVPQLTGVQVKTYLVAYPSIKGQEEIAKIISTWDEAISTVEKLIKTKRLYKKGLMQRLLTGKVRFPEYTGEWKEVHFNDVVKIDAKSLNSKTSPNYRFKYISLSDIKNGIISEELEVHDYRNAPSRAKRIISDGDILMATVRPNLQTFAIAEKEHQDMIASTGFAVLSPKKNFNIKYLYHYLYSHHISSQLHALTVGSSYPAINSSDVKKLKIYIPTNQEEVDKIESVFTTIDKEIKRLEQIKDLFVIQKKGLMQKLLTGKVRVNKLEGV